MGLVGGRGGWISWDGRRKGYMLGVMVRLRARLGSCSHPYGCGEVRCGGEGVVGWRMGGGTLPDRLQRRQRAGSAADRAAFTSSTHLLYAKNKF